MARATHVKAARKTIPESVCGVEGGIKKGTSYYWWKFRRGGKRFSITPPKRSQLTQSSFYSTIYDLEDDVIAKATADSTLEATRDDIVQQLEELRDQCQESLDNMPEGLQEGPTGQLLQERIDALETAMDEFEQLELAEPDEDDLEIDDEKGEDETQEEYEARIERERFDETQSYWDSKLEELQGVSIDAP